MSELRGPPAQEIQKLFNSVAHGYDKANDYMTFGLVHRWRKVAVKWSGVKPGARVLDCATGTGDLAFEFKRRVGTSGEVIGTDFCEAMLAHAPAKANKLGLPVQFQTADVLQLPFPDKSFDVCSIAYGIRNVEDPVRALSEMARVVKPGGCVMVLETGDGQWPLIDFYFRNVVPRIGGWVTGRREAYEYLSRSSNKFPSGQQFIELMKETGRFSTIQYKRFMGGGSFVYRGQI
jgi:demethylmenaquinone methyltransferase/2-methoxy-6-polyprenyl-1,4-benzoquinol methylase